jgi:pimeloyl-ACP methyl ester carboxylesterase
MIFPAELVERAAYLIPTARGVILAEAGHMAHIDQPSTWLTTIADFLEAEDETS